MELQDLLAACPSDRPITVGCGRSTSMYVVLKLETLWAAQQLSLSCGAKHAKALEATQVWMES